MVNALRKQYRKRREQRGPRRRGNRHPTPAPEAAETTQEAALRFAAEQVKKLVARLLHVE